MVPCLVLQLGGLSLQSFHDFFTDGFGENYVFVASSCFPLRVGKSPRVEFQYSAAYSVPWSPRHSSVNSFTTSFTLLLLTRSLHESRGSEGANKRDKKQTITKCMWNFMQLIHQLISLAAYLSICCEKLCFCSTVTRDDGNPGGCSASFSHTASREKQFLFRLKRTSANWSMRLRDAPPPMPWREEVFDISDLITKERKKSLKCDNTAKCLISEMMKPWWCWCDV